MSMSVIVRYYFFFFFQAEDGIRDDLVTGVQTCALPICSWVLASSQLDERKPPSLFESEYPIMTSNTPDRKSTRLNSSHQIISYAVFCLKKKNLKIVRTTGAGS